MVKYHPVNHNDPWPEAISDELTLPCGICDKHTNIDYRISDKVWNQVVPIDLRLSVVCLDCLIGLDPNVIRHIEEIQIVGGGRTIRCLPDTLYDYREVKKR